MNARLSRDLKPLRNILQTQLNRAIISDTYIKVLREILVMFGSLLLDRNGSRTETSVMNQSLGNKLKEPFTKLTTKDLGSTSDRREKVDLTPYMETKDNDNQQAIS